METKHTKGEWFVSNEDQIVSMPSQCKIANRISGWNYEEAKANAKLIASAPELLEALITMYDLAIHESGSMKERLSGNDVAIEKCRKAIKKATE
jgi:hypothetical protein